MFGSQDSGPPPASRACAHMCLCTCMCAQVRAYQCTHVHMCRLYMHVPVGRVCTQACMCILYVCMCVHVCERAQVCFCIGVCTHMYLCVCMSICVSYMCEHMCVSCMGTGACLLDIAGSTCVFKHTRPSARLPGAGLLSIRQALRPSFFICSVCYFSTLKTLAISSRKLCLCGNEMPALLGPPTG